MTICLSAEAAPPERQPHLQVEDRKVLDKIKETATIKEKKISSEKFREL